MTSIDVKPLQQGLGFGARIRGVTFATLDDEAVRRQINEVFQDRGLIVFEDVEPTPQMHLAISDVFGPLKEHPVPSVVRVDGDSMPGVIDMQTTPEAGSSRPGCPGISTTATTMNSTARACCAPSMSHPRAASPALPMASRSTMIFR